MNVDWSKAPQSATHFVMSNEDGIPGGWYRADGIKMRDIANEGEYTFRLDDLHPQRMLHLIERPTQWDGEGLPARGTKCECRPWKGHDAPWTEVEFIASWLAPNGQTYSWVHTGYGGLEPQMFRFRPIRTPEQIAAELECVTIKEICGDLDVPIAIARKAYEKGYRKQVTP